MYVFMSTYYISFIRLFENNSEAAVQQTKKYFILNIEYKVLKSCSVTGW